MKTPCFHLLHLSLAFLDTLMLQKVVAQPEWRGSLTPADLRGLTPLL